MKIVNRMPRVGEVIVNEEGNFGVVIGYYALTALEVIKLGGCMIDTVNSCIRNADSTISYLDSTITDIIYGKIKITAYDLAGYCVRYNSMLSGCYDGKIVNINRDDAKVVGVLDGYSYDEAKISRWILKSKLASTDSVFPKFICIDKELTLETERLLEKKRVDKENRKLGVYANRDDLVAGMLYKAVNEKFLTYFLYLGDYKGDKFFGLIYHDDSDELVLDKYVHVKRYKNVPKLYSKPVREEKIKLSEFTKAGRTNMINSCDYYNLEGLEE